MAITLHGIASTPADDAANAGPTVTVTPPASMLADDYVLVFCTYKATSSDINVTTTGGQTWTEEAMQGSATSGVRSRLFRCKFDGTWAANPVFTQSTGGGAALSAVMVVYRGVDTTTPIDVAESSSVHAAPSTPFDVSIASITTATANARVVAFWSSVDNNTWAVQTASWTNPGSAQHRNTQGTDTSIAVAHREFASAGATGAVVNRQATLGGDSGTTHIIALAAAASGGTTIKDFTAALTFAGVFAKRPARSLGSGLTFSGAINKRPGKALSSALTFAGSAFRRTGRAFASALTFSGALTAQKLVVKALAAALSFSGSLSRRPAKSLASALTFSALLGKRTSRVFGSGLTFVGVLTVQRFVVKLFTAGLTFSGSMSRRAGKSLVASLATSGAMAKRTARTVSGGLTFVGAMASTRLLVRALASSLSFSGSMTKRGGKSFGSVLTFSGGIARRVARSFGSQVTFAGALASGRLIVKFLSSALSFVGDLVRQTVDTIIVSGSSQQLLLDMNAYWAAYDEAPNETVRAQLLFDFLLAHGGRLRYGLHDWKEVVGGVYPVRW